MDPVPRTGKETPAKHLLYMAFGFLALALNPNAIHAWPTDTTQIISLPEEPGPEELAAAKAALAAGEIIMTEGRDTRKFDSLLDVGVGAFRPQALSGGQSAEILRIMAVRLASNGSLHSYECYAPRRFANRSPEKEKNCKGAFRAWVGTEGAGITDGVGFTDPPNPLADDWTELGRPDIDYFDDNGNLLTDRVRLYRLNDNSSLHDWYLIVRDPLSAPHYFNDCGFGVNCGWLTSFRDFQTSLDPSLVADPNFRLYEWSPENEIGNGRGAISIGVSLSGVVPSPGVGYSFDWDQPDVRTTIYTSIGQKETSWVESFNSGRTLTNSEPFISHNASIFQVPDAYGTFNVRLYSQFKSIFHTFLGKDTSERTDYRPVSLAAPVFRVTPTELTLVAKGNATLALEAAIPGYSYQGVRWTVVKEPEGFSVSPTSGSGPINVNVKARSAEVGDVDYIEFQTDPPYAAPSVAKAPLRVKVTVVDNPPTEGVLLAGGLDWNGETLSSAEVWDPATKTSKSALYMHSARRDHTAITLEGGKILIAGGYDNSGHPENTAELFDPATGQFEVTGSMSTPRALHTATVLNTGPLAGDVLIAGGCCVPGTNDALQSAEIYDPHTGVFSAAKDMRTQTMRHTATRLTDGSVLLAGGTINLDDYDSLAVVQIFNPASAEFETRAGLHLATGRQGHAATLLMNGQVLVTGG